MRVNTIAVIFLLLGCAFGTVFAADCTCTDEYGTSQATSDTDCSALKTYIICIETGYKTTPCTVPSANVPAIKDKTSCSMLEAPCECQRIYWGTDLTQTGELCKALAAYKTCLDSANTGAGCGSETTETLKTFVTNHQTSNNCPCTCTPEYGTSEAATDTLCSALKAYIRCIETDYKNAPCTVPAANLPFIKTKTTCSPKLKDTCECQIKYWGTDLTQAGEPCTALAAYKMCLNEAKEDTGCVSTTRTDLKTFVTNQETSKTCSTTVSTTTQKNSKGNSGARTLGKTGMTALSIFVFLMCM